MLACFLIFFFIVYGMESNSDKMDTDNKIKDNMSENDEKFYCDICFKNFPFVMKTKCNHKFCISCIYRFLEKKPTNCPICRAALTDYLNDYSYVNINLKNIDEMEFGDFQNSFPLLPWLPRTSCDDILTWLSHKINPDHVCCLNIFRLNQLASKGAALHHAVILNKLDLVKCLIDNGADKAYAAQSEFTAFILAAGYAKLEIVDYFLHTLGANVNQNRLAGTPLIFAVARNRLQMVSYLIKHGANVNLGSLSVNITPLILASQNGNFPIVQLLLQNNANVHTITFESRNALYYAVTGGSVEIVKALLEHGAEINYRNETYGTPLFQAVKTGNLPMVQFLLDREEVNVNLGTSLENKTPLMISVENEQFEITRALLRHPKIEITNTYIYQGIPALHYWASHNTPIEIIEDLIKNGAEINKNIETVGTPLHVSAGKGNLDVVHALIGHNANVNVVNNYEKTPLLLATSEGFFKIVRALLESKANVHTCDYNGISAIHLAAMENHLKIMKLLIHFKADINSKARGGLSPIHLAAHSGHLEAVKALIRFGANVRHKTDDDQSVIDWAYRSGNAELINFLQDHLATNSEIIPLKPLK